MNRQKKVVMALGLCVMMGMSGLEAMVGGPTSRVYVKKGAVVLHPKQAVDGRQAMVDQDGNPVTKYGQRLYLTAAGVPLKLNKQTASLEEISAIKLYTADKSPEELDGVYQPVLLSNPLRPKPVVRPLTIPKTGTPLARRVVGDAVDDAAELPEDSAVGVGVGRPNPAKRGGPGRTISAKRDDADDGVQQTDDDGPNHEDLGNATATPIEKVKFKKIKLSKVKDDKTGVFEEDKNIDGYFNQLKHAESIPTGTTIQRANIQRDGSGKSRTATIYDAGLSKEAIARRNIVTKVRSRVEQHVATETEKMELANTIFVNRIFNQASDSGGVATTRASFRAVRSAYSSAYKDPAEARAAAINDANKLANLYAMHGSSTTVFKRFKSNIREKMQTLSGGQLACYVGVGLLLSPIKGPLLLFGALMAISKIPSMLRRRRLEKPLREMLKAYDITDEEFVKMRTMARKVEEANDPKADLGALNEVVNIFRGNAEARRNAQAAGQAILRGEAAEVSE